MRRETRVVLAMISVFIFALAGCMRPEYRPISELKDPGFFDIGIGYGRIDGIGSGKDDALGLVGSIRAYPFGRWYSELKSVPKSQLSSAIQAGLDDMYKSKDRVLQADLQAVSLTAAESDHMSSLLGWAKDVSPALAMGHPETLELIIRVQTGVSEEHRKLVAERYPQSTKLLNAIAGEQLKGPDGFVNSITGGNLYGRLDSDSGGDYFMSGLRRLSCFYGISSGDFTAGSQIKSAVHTFGVGFDVTPQVALLFGFAFFEREQTDGTSDDLDHALFTGVSLNLNAFKSLLSAVTD